MSASSVCVTCGTLTHDACRRGPEMRLMRDSGTVSIGPNLAKSTAGIAGRAPPPAGAPPAPPRDSAAFTSSRVMRPFSPVPLSVLRSRSSSRASRRTAGPAKTPEKSALAGPEAGARAGGRSLGATGEVSGASAASSSSFASASSSCAEEIGAAGPPASSFAIRAPIDTLSPTLAMSWVILPAAGDGTSIVALSDSSVTSGCSASTVSPAFTRTSMTGTSLKSPMSGTVMSIVAALGDAGAAAALAGAAGAALAGAEAALAGAASARPRQPPSRCGR